MKCRLSEMSDVPNQFFLNRALYLLKNPSFPALLTLEIMGLWTTITVLICEEDILLDKAALRVAVSFYTPNKPIMRSS